MVVAVPHDHRHSQVHVPSSVARGISQQRLYRVFYRHFLFHTCLLADYQVVSIHLVINFYDSGKDTVVSLAKKRKKDATFLIEMLEEKFCRQKLS